jgi:hypothetical protein
MRVFLIAAAAAGIVATAADSVFTQEVRQAAAPSIEGVWEGVSIVTTGANASTNPKRLPNVHIYSKGYYSVIAQDATGARPPRQAPPPLQTPGKPTDAEKIAYYDFWAPLTAHSGTYEVKGNRLIQRQMVSKNALPSAVGSGVELRYEDGGKTRIEILRSPPGQPVSETRRTYRRLE